jgi:hypothetical protein
MSSSVQHRLCRGGVSERGFAAATCDAGGCRSSVRRIEFVMATGCPAYPYRMTGFAVDPGNRAATERVARLTAAVNLW